MAKHHAELNICLKQPGRSIGKVCGKCDGKCVICDSYVNVNKLVRICDECNFSFNNGKCIICCSNGTSDAYYCKSCCLLEKDREGCPKVTNYTNQKKEFVFNKKAEENNLEKLLNIN